MVTVSVLLLDTGASCMRLCGLGHAWVEAPEMKTPRLHGAAATLEGSVYVVTGFHMHFMVRNV